MDRATGNPTTLSIHISHEIPTGGGRPIRLPQNNSQEQVTTPRLGGQTDQVYSGVMIAK